MISGSLSELMVHVIVAAEPMMATSPDILASER